MESSRLERCIKIIPCNEVRVTRRRKARLFEARASLFPYLECKRLEATEILKSMTQDILRRSPVAFIDDKLPVGIRYRQGSEDRPCKLRARGDTELEIGPLAEPLGLLQRAASGKGELGLEIYRNRCECEEPGVYALTEQKMFTDSGHEVFPITADFADVQA